MSECKAMENKKFQVRLKKKKTPEIYGHFYGALKSKNEIYYQMASLFKEVTRDEGKIESQWMDRILTSDFSNISGKFFINNL